jgi:hypothetical protein
MRIKGAAGQALGRWMAMRVFLSTTRAAIFTSLSRRVSNWAHRQGERFGSAARRIHISQYAPACRNSRSWFAAALVQEVRSAARWVFQALIWFSAWPRA